MTLATVCSVSMMAFLTLRPEMHTTEHRPLRPTVLPTTNTLQEQSLVKSCTIGFRVTLNPCQRVVDRGYNCISHDGLTWILPYPPQTKLANEIRRLAQLSAKRV